MHGFVFVVYVAGALVVSGYFANGRCQFKSMPDTWVCTGIFSVAWPAALPIDISVRAFARDK